MQKVYARPKSIKNILGPYCPGCMHGLITKLIAQVIDELAIAENTICVLPVGCSTLGRNYWNLDMVSSAHGRAPAVATGIKRCRQDVFVLSYQGDGDLAAIGLSEIIHAANRGENFTTIFVNNSIYGMTGGQMAPTTLIGQKTTTTKQGRSAAMAGYPIKMCEQICQLEAPVYVARFATNSPSNIIKAKAGIKKAFMLQLEGKGFSFVEILSNCPTNWGMSPSDSLDYMEEYTIKQFPLGVFKELKEE